HRLVRNLSLIAFREKKDFKDMLLQSEEIRKILSPKEIEEIFDPYKYVSVAKERVLRLIKIAEEKLGEKIMEK
ncbi:MAG: hypothetical protein DRZ80_05280, partial [Thermoprotei archaeon]